MDTISMLAALEACEAGPVVEQDGAAEGEGAEPGPLGASLGGIVLYFADVIDATDVQDFAVTAGQADATDVAVDYADDGGATVTFAPGILVDNPELILGILQAYAEAVAAEDAGAADAVWAEAVAAAEAPELFEAKKDPGVMVKFNAFHDADGRMTTRQAAATLAYGTPGTQKKWKYTGKGSFGGKATKTKTPCGRDARALGGDVRCWDGKVISPISKGKTKKKVGLIKRAIQAFSRKK